MQFRVVTNIRPGLAQRTQQYFLRQLQNVNENAKQTFETITNSWEHKPEFRSSMRQDGTKITMSVLTDSDIFNWVDKGTKPHRIPRSGRTFMTFTTGYTPRTRPGRLQFVMGGAVGGDQGEQVFTTVADHPGIEPRNFTKIVSAQTMREALRVLGRSTRTLPL